MFYQDSQGIFRVRPLESFAWLEHGFGTRHAARLAHDPRLATLHQIHSDICVAAGGRTGLLGEGDGLLESTPGRLVAVKTADCIPILLVDEEHRAVAAVHAGWRGAVHGIAGQAVRRMQEEFGSRPGRLHAAIGPGIGKCCYQVGPEVAAQFGEAGHAYIDLAEANRGQLRTAGVPESHIYVAGLCTRCGESDFHSYRRDKERSGRMLSFVGVR
ncbi:MAG TPA: peptidoglycan editing factor PgeF [Bryobacteraceae bacterium]|nr:peptidoglycan editing factor PgeF [Bryobacteraceae bacterium]